MNKTHNLFYIESPFQLMQVYEILTLQGNIKYKILIRLIHLNIGNQQLKNLVKVFRFNDVEYFPCNSNSMVRTKINLIALAIRTLRESLASSDIYIGDENSIIFKLIRNFIGKDKIILLDDGVATLNTKLENQLYRRFTIFKNGAMCNVNEFRNIGNFINRGTERNNVHLIVGSKFVEEGIITRECYFKVLKKMIKTQDKNKDFIYVPHRGESVDNLERIKNDLGLHVVKTSLPIEFIRYELGIVPMTVHTILSTSIFSMQLIYKETGFITYKVKDREILSRRQAILNLNKHFESIKNLTIIMVD